MKPARQQVGSSLGGNAPITYPVHIGITGSKARVLGGMEDIWNGKVTAHGSHPDFPVLAALLRAAAAVVFGMPVNPDESVTVEFNLDLREGASFGFLMRANKVAVLLPIDPAGPKDGPPAMFRDLAAFEAFEESVRLKHNDQA